MGWQVNELSDIRKNIARLLERTKASGIGGKSLQSALYDAMWAAGLACDETVSLAWQEAHD